MDSSIKVADLRAARGVAWLSESFRLFRRAPMAWIALCAGWITITLALMIVPVIGPVAANFLQPVFFASFAIAAFKQAAGEPIVMGDLFTAFRRNVRALVNLGALMLLAQIAIFALMALAGLPITAISDVMAKFDDPQARADYAELMDGKEWVLVSGFVLTVLVKGSVWFAPQLIAFHGMSTTHAIRWSAYAALSNATPMLVYAVLLAVVFVLGIIPWGLGLFVVVPTMVISTYVGYREVFESQ